MLRRTFKAFSYPQFRLIWGGAVISSIGTWMQKLAQSWLVLELSGSPFLLGLDAFLGEAPILLFSILAGVAADRMSRRNLLIGSQIVQMTCAGLLAALFSFQVIAVWHILALSFVVGTAQAFGAPAYQALIPSLVGPKDVPNAIAMNSIQFNLARIIGPVLGGIALKQLGAVWCFGLNSVSYIPVILSLLTLSAGAAAAARAESVAASIRQGLRFVTTQPAMSSLMVISFATTLLGLPFIVFLPVIAKNVFLRGAETYTLLMAVSGAGSVFGALGVAFYGHHPRMGRAAVTLIVVLAVTMGGFAVSTLLPLSCALLFAGSAAMMAVFALVSSLVQALVSDEMRGRVMSVYNVAFRGGMPLGSLLGGALVPLLGAPVALTLNAVLLAALGLYFLFVHRRVASL